MKDITKPPQARLLKKHREVVRALMLHGGSSEIIVPSEFLLQYYESINLFLYYPIIHVSEVELWTRRTTFRQKFISLPDHNVSKMHEHAPCTAYTKSSVVFGLDVWSNSRSWISKLVQQFQSLTNKVDPRCWIMRSRAELYFLVFNPRRSSPENRLHTSGAFLI